MLQIKDIKKDYVTGSLETNAIKGITLDFRHNEFVAILGPSGCGKTTLMNIVGGLDKATAGEIIIEGVSTKNYKDKEWDNYRNKKIGFVFQSYNLIPHLSVFQNVEIALTISGLKKEERKRKVHEVLEKVDLTDQANKKPNQLSGGQQQRVAIARALVNDPEILLADEPTGSLDTENSEQIMKLIKEISIDHLAIMVTHNPELAEKYATRLIKMKDGLVVGDSNPYIAIEDINFFHNIGYQRAVFEMENGCRKKPKNKTSMSYTTALSLSGRNLSSKKGRTILISIAGSIGIIGIALILALSGGMNNYIRDLQANTLSSSPITISTNSVDMTQVMNAYNNSTQFEEYPDAQKVYVEKVINQMDLMSKNNITEEYVTYVKDNIDSSLYNDMTFMTGLDFNIYGIKNGTDYYSKLDLNSTTPSFFGNTVIWQQLLQSEFTKNQYDVIAGKFPESMNDVVLVVSLTNQISETTLISLGLKNVNDGVEEIKFTDIIDKEFKVVANNAIYEKDGSSFKEKSSLDINYENEVSVKISGILRIKESADAGSLSPGIGYSKVLYDTMQITNSESEIITFMNDNPTISPFTGLAYSDTITYTKEELRNNDYRSLGGEFLPNEINIYPRSFETKDKIKKVLDDYNVGKEKEAMITYTDMSELLGDTISTLVNTVTYVLIGFTAISLVVSCIMIAIITYISVLERRKEIGVLRSLGARKKDVSRIFVAESGIIGFFAGLLGVVVAYILTIPINLIFKATLGIAGIASLNIGFAVLLVVISVILTLFSGLIPSKKAAKQDPVVALRTD